MALAVGICGAAKSGAETSAQNSPEAAKLNQRGVEHLQKKDYDAAIANFREALQQQPEFPEALDNLGKALDATGKDDEALSDFDKALKLAPQDATVHCDKGLALLHEKKFEE